MDEYVTLMIECCCCPAHLRVKKQQLQYEGYRKAGETEGWAFGKYDYAYCPDHIDRRNEQGGLFTQLNPSKDLTPVTPQSGESILAELRKALDLPEED